MAHVGRETKSNRFVASFLSDTGLTKRLLIRVMVRLEIQSALSAIMFPRTDISALYVKLRLSIFATRQAHKETFKVATSVASF